MKSLPAITVLVLAGVFLFMLHTASARAPIASGGTCSVATTVDAVLGTSSRNWLIRDNALSGAPNCGTVSQPLTEVNAGASITLKCYEITSGANVPAEATTLTVSGVADNTNFGSATPSSIWSQTVVGCGAGVTLTSVFCTSNALAGGTPWYGIVRIHIRAQNVVGPTTVYDVNSETDPGGSIAGVPGPTVGIYRCNPKPTVLDMGTSPLNPWIGGDSPTIRTAVDSTSEISQTTGIQRLVCSSSPNHDASAIQFGTSTSTATFTVVGPPNDWQTGCTFVAEAILNRKSSISLYSTTDYAVWNQASPPAGVVFPDSLTAAFTGNTLNRILTKTGTCTVTVLGTTTTVVNRGEVVHITGCSPWKDGRGNNVLNNQPASTFVQRGTQWQITTDFGRFDGLFGASGAFPSDNTATSSATVTTGLAYRKMVLEYSTTARTDAVLFNWGNSTGIVDVSATFFLGSPTPTNGILNSKTAGGANVSAFTISVDSQHVSVRNVVDASGNPVASVPVTCFRTRPDLVTESTVSVGSTDSSGNTPDTTFSVIAPGGRWHLTCSGTLNGNTFNTGSYDISFFFTSAFTADKTIPILWNVTGVNATHSRVNITMGFWFYNPGVAPATDGMECLFPDDVVRLTIRAYNSTSTNYDIIVISRQVMVPSVLPSGALECDWTFNLTVANSTLAKGAWAFTTFNFTGSPFAGSEAYILQTQSSGVDIMGAVTFPAWDPYVPLFVWGVLLILFYWLEAYIAAAGVLLAFADSILANAGLANSGIFWRLMLFAVTLTVQAIYTAMQKGLLIILGINPGGKK